VSKNIELVPAAGGTCGTVKENCIDVALSIKGQLEFMTKPVHSLLLEVEVRYDSFIYTDIVTFH
jgi:hypothetical protein